MNLSIKIILHSPLFQRLWKIIRLHKILKKQKAVSNFWQPIINAYYKGEIKKYNLQPKKQLPNNRIIWQYWGQGLENNDLPEIIRICFNSVDKYKDDFQVIRLNDETIKEYIDLPDFVWGKRKNPGFNQTFFSDLLRLALLDIYGGVWLDATVLLTGPLLEQWTQKDYFVYQRSDEEIHKGYWENTYAYYWNWRSDFKVRMLNSIFFAKAKSKVVAILLDLMLYYWETENHIIDYFFFQILYNELITGNLSKNRCSIVSDVLPHLLQTKINNPDCNFITYKSALKTGNIHKMAYFKEEAMERLRQIII